MITNGPGMNPMNIEPSSNLDELKKGINNKKEQINKILKNLRVTLLGIDNILDSKEKKLKRTTKGNLTNEVGGLDEKKGRSVSDEDLEKLENEIKRKKFLAGLKKRFIYDDEVFEKSLKEREVDMFRAYAEKGTTGVLTQLLTQRKIRSRLGLSGLGTSAKKHVKEALSQWIVSTHEDMLSSKTSSSIRFRKSVIKEKIKKKKQDAVSSAFVIKIRESIRDVTDDINRYIGDAKQAVLSRYTGSRLSKSLVNAQTSIKESRFLNKSGAVIGKTTGGIKKVVIGTGKGLRSVATGIGKGVSIVADVGKGLANVTKSGFSGVIYGGIAYLAFGQSVPALIAVGGISAVARMGKLVLGDRYTSPIKFMKEFQLKHGWGQYLQKEGGWSLQAITNAGKNPIGRLAKIVRLTDSGSRFGAIGSALGAGIAALTGAPITLGAAIGMGIGSLGGIGGEAINIRILNSLSKQAKLLQVLSQIPTFELMSNVTTNLWLASQIELIKSKYKGNVGAYLRENFWEGENDNTKLENWLLVGSNWLNLTLGLPYTVFPVTMARAFLSIAQSTLNKFYLLKNPFAATSNAIALGMVAGQVVGTLAGALTLSILGIPFGTGAIIGATIGAALGGLLGAFITIASFGLGFWTTFGLTAAFSAVGSWIGTVVGGAVDKATNGIAGLIGMLFNGVSALFSLITLMRTKLNIDSLLMIIIALLSLFQSFDRMGVFESAYQCVDENYCPDPNASPGYGIYYLDNYNIGLIKQGDLTQIENENLLAYLDNDGDKIVDMFKGKKVLLNLINDASYETPQLVIIGSKKEHLDDINELSTHLTGQLAGWSTLSIASEEDLAFNFN